jgi:hypothetical protein
VHPVLLAQALTLMEERGQEGQLKVRALAVGCKGCSGLQGVMHCGILWDVRDAMGSCGMP